MNGSSSTRPGDRAVAAWLIAVLIAVLVMVAVGGLTRLTDSGLSMTDWKPILGMRPPLDAAGWEERFAQYRELPQYQMFADQNRSVGLAEFKWMFFWEYLHRMLGRLTGLIAAIPFFWFWFRGRFRSQPGPTWTVRMFLVPLLIGAQGLLGWFMVRSGLSELTYVSHFRLAAHLGLAFLVFAYVLWQWLSWRRRYTDAPNWRRAGLTGGAWLFSGLLVLQIIYGAFVAGLKAGPAYSSWPTYAGQWWPTGLFQRTSDLWSSPPLVHVVHRTLAGAVLIGAIALWLAVRRKAALARPRQTGSTTWVLLLTLAQFGFGVWTVLAGTPMGLAAIHQINACLLVGATTVMVFHLGR